MRGGDLQTTRKQVCTQGMAHLGFGAEIQGSQVRGCIQGGPIGGIHRFRGGRLDAQVGVELAVETIDAFSVHPGLLFQDPLEVVQGAVEDHAHVAFSQAGDPGDLPVGQAGKEFQRNQLARAVIQAGEGHGEAGALLFLLGGTAPRG